MLVENISLILNFKKLENITFILVFKMQVLYIFCKPYLLTAPTGLLTVFFQVLPLHNYILCFPKEIVDGSNPANSDHQLR
jgi:hypothetical protein